MMGEVVVANCDYCIDETLSAIDRAAAQEFPECFKQGQLSPERFQEYVAFRTNLLNRKKKRCHRFDCEKSDVAVCADCLRKAILELE